MGSFQTNRLFDVFIGILLIALLAVVFILLIKFARPRIEDLFDNATEGSSEATNDADSYEKSVATQSTTIVANLSALKDLL